MSDLRMNLRNLTARALTGEWPSETDLRNQILRCWKGAAFDPPATAELRPGVTSAEGIARWRRFQETAKRLIGESPEGEPAADGSTFGEPRATGIQPDEAPEGGETLRMAMAAAVGVDFERVAAMTPAQRESLLRQGYALPEPDAATAAACPEAGHHPRHARLDMACPSCGWTQPPPQSDEEVRASITRAAQAHACPEKRRHAVFSRRGDACPTCGWTRPEATA